LNSGGECGNVGYKNRGERLVQKRWFQGGRLHAPESVIRMLAALHIQWGEQHLVSGFFKSPLPGMIEVYFSKFAEHFVIDRVGNIFANDLLPVIRTH